MLTALTILLAASPVHAADADSQSFVLSTDVEAWPVTDIDSGWWPADGPIRVRTVLFAEGIAGIDIEGESIVETGNAGTTQRLDQNTAEGEASIELNVDAALHLSINVAGYSWEDVLHEQTVNFDISESFDSFAFADDGGTTLSFPMDTVEVFEVDQGIMPMVEVVVSGALSPEASVTLNTDFIETEAGTFTADGQAVDTKGGQMEVDGTGTLDSTLNLLIQGHAEVCITWVDCYGDFNYDFALDPIDHSQELVYEPVTINHEVAPTSNGGMADSGNPAAESSGGCSTSPTAPHSAWMVALMMAVLGIRRRKDSAHS